MAKNYIFENETLWFTSQTIGGREVLKVVKHFELPEEPEDLRKYSIEIDGEKYLYTTVDGGGEPNFS